MNTTVIKKLSAGQVSTAELGAVLGQLGYKVQDAELRDMIASVDEDESGSCGPAEFQNLMEDLASRGSAFVVAVTLAYGSVRCVVRRLRSRC